MQPLIVLVTVPLKPDQSGMPPDFTSGSIGRSGSWAGTNPNASVSAFRKRTRKLFYKDPSLHPIAIGSG
ncbi:hypothetical protein J7E50_20740 [Pedobacter sp. ISL-68]|uniref:hypothetical protein n=1 Tax=unclassified Pedobacter TaxID=2628915 RepID=UPI001BE4F5FB|nr:MULTISPECIES: hypothetical protein [unclassified Pedobacter]MBT2592658.1 hypothetical protein [Pedobacter sp. ISL-68]